MLNSIPIEIQYLAAVDSTQAYVKELIAKGHGKHGLSVEAGFQSNGKGQVDGFWMSDPGLNSLFSLCIQPPKNCSKSPFKFSMLVALALKDYCASLGLEARIKWPNDIYIGQLKIAGILIQNQFVGHDLKWSIWGIGFNVNQDDFGMLNGHATSVKSQGNTIKTKDATKGIYHFLDLRYKELLLTEGRDFKREFEDDLMGLREQRNYQTKEGMIHGSIIGVDEEGRLLVKSNEEILSFGNKEIQWIM